MCKGDTVTAADAAQVEPKQQQQQQQQQPQQPQPQAEAAVSRRRRISSRMAARQANGNAVVDGVAAATTTATSANTTAPPPPGLGRLFICAMGICICYLYYGILQERLFSGKEHRRPLGATFVLVTQCIANVFVARFWQYVQDRVLLNKKEANQATTKGDAASPIAASLGLHHSLLLVTSGCYVAAMVCSNEAIQYVSYPVAVLAKSCKLIPSMLVGQLVEGRLYTHREWIAALLISAGIVLFHSHRLFIQQTQNNKNVLYENDNDKSNHGHYYGLILLLISLAMDGLLSSCQNFLKRKPPTSLSDTCNTSKNKKSKSYRPPSAVETMLYINLYALIFLIPLAMMVGQFTEGIERLLFLPATDSTTALLGREDSNLCWALLLLNATVAFGQIFIFLTIHWYTPLVTTTITTTRKFFTILLSVITFGHEFTKLQWTAVALVFSGLYLSIFGSTNHNTTTTPTSKSSTTSKSETTRITTSDNDDSSGLHQKTE